MIKNILSSIAFIIVYVGGIVGMIGTAYTQDRLVSKQKWKHGPLKITADGHFFSYEDGTPFFWLGDTAWELFNRLRKEEIIQYLDNRKKKGFNVIQAVILANTDRPMTANQYGHTPLIHDKLDSPNEAYFELIDWTVKQALERNMFIGLLPTWGDKVLKLWGKGEEIFNEDNAFRYGQYLGKRYRKYPNIIWITGGDRPAVLDSVDKRPVWEAMIKGIRSGSNNKGLISYHPWGEGSSTQFWKQASPLDFDMIQSGHRVGDLPVDVWVKRDFNMIPAKPVLDAEPTYEDHPINWKVNNGYFRAYDVRKQLYRSVFSGACGVTYGHQAVWQFYSERVEKIVDPDRYWQQALDRPGAFQAGYLKDLILSRSSTNRIFESSILLDTVFSESSYPLAFGDKQKQFLMVYLPEGGEISLNGKYIQAEKLQTWWFSPKSGSALNSGVVSNQSNLNFKTPTSGIGEDWVLVLEDARLKFGPPGKK